MKVVFDTHGNDKQKEVVKLWINKTTTDIVYGGSKGSGKSFLGCSLILGDALIYPGTSYFIARKALNDLRKFTIPSINEVLGLWGVDSKYYSYNGMDNYFKFYNESKVYLLDAKPLPSDPEYYRFGSMQMTRGWIEEAGEFEQSAKNNLSASIGRWKNKEYGLTGKLLQSCNPAKNYLYRDYYKKNKVGTLEDWKAFVQALPTDNKMLPDGYLENLNRVLTKNEKERLLKGNWEYDDDPSALIDYDKILDVFRNDYVEHGERYITADIARLGRDATIILVWSGLRVIELVRIAKNKITECAEAIKQLQSKYTISTSNILCDEDGVGGGVVDILSCKGFQNNSRPIDIENGDIIFKPNFDNLKSQCYFLLADKINKGQIYLNIKEEYKDLVIEELEQVKQKSIDSDMKKGIVPKDKIKEIIGRSPDFSDAIMMRMWFELQPDFTKFKWVF